MRAVLMMCLMAVVLMATLTLASPLDLGFGGVYNNPEANAYWARRFPGLFGGASRMSSLRALQVQLDYLLCYEKTLNTYLKAKKSLHTTQISSFKYVIIIFPKK